MSEQKNKTALISIREAVTTDISLMQEFILEHGQNPWNFLPENETKAHIAKIETKMVRAYLAEIQDKCVGFASFYVGLPQSCKKYVAEPINTIAYLSEIVVHQNYVGRGIGSQLIDTIKNYLVANNITQLYAERHADNPGSAGVMMKTGFEIIDEFIDRDRESRKTVVTRLKL